MFSTERQFLELHVERSWLLDDVFLLLGVGDGVVLMEFRERIELCLDVVLLELTLDDRVIVPEHERVVLCEVLGDSHLGIHVVLHLEVVAVEMVGRDIHEDGDIRLEVIHVVELETGELNYIIVEAALRHLQRKAASDVSCKSHVVARLFEDVVDERGGRGLTVGTGDADHLGVGVSTGELDFGDDVNPLLPYFLNHWRLVGYSRALDDFVGIEDFLLRMLFLFPLNVVVVEQFLIFVLNFSEVGHEDLKSLLLCENGSSCSALRRTKNNNTLRHVFRL